MREGYRVQWCVRNSYYDEDYCTLYFEDEQDFAEHINKLKNAAYEVEKLTGAVRACKSYLSAAPKLKDYTCIDISDDGDTVEIKIIFREADQRDLKDFTCDKGHLIGIDECYCDGPVSYWIEEVAGRKYVVREELCERPIDGGDDEEREDRPQ